MHHKCSSCGESFASDQYLKIHIFIVHQGNTKIYKCESCNKSFSRKDSVNRHIKRVHKKQKDHKCDFCQKSFGSAQYLKIHISTIHEGHKDHKCDLCQDTFSRKDSLNRHIKKVHKKQKDQKCELCEETFSRNDALNRHIKCVYNSINGNHLPRIKEKIESLFTESKLKNSSKIDILKVDSMKVVNTGKEYENDIELEKIVQTDNIKISKKPVSRSNFRIVPLEEDDHNFKICLQNPKCDLEIPALLDKPGR